MDPMLAISTSLCFSLFYISLFKLLKKRRKSFSKIMNEAQIGAMKELQQLLGGIKPVKIHGQETHFISRYGGHSYTMAQLSKWAPVYQNFPRYLIEPLAFGGLVAFVVILAARGENISTLLPTLGVMALAGYRLLPNFQLLYGIATGISLMMYSLDEVYAEFSVADDDERETREPKNVVEKPIHWTQAVEFKDVSFNYNESGKPVLRDVSFSIRKNEFIAFIGETGSGKSTLVDLLMALHRAKEGTILIDGNPLTAELHRRWRAGIGYVPQEIFLLDDTVATNIAFGLRDNEVDMAQVKRVAKIAQISEFIENELPEGYSTEVGERGVRLSGGQRQRIGLARALYHNPEMLVLDEATSALDSTTEKALLEAIENLFGRMTLVVIAHRLTTIRNANQICVLKEGTISEKGTYAELGLDAADSTVPSEA